MKKYLNTAKGKNPEFQGDGRILDSGFGIYGKIPDSAFRIMDSTFWIREIWNNSRFWIWDSKFGKNGTIPDSAFRIPGKCKQNFGGKWNNSELQISREGGGMEKKIKNQEK